MGGCFFVKSGPLPPQNETKLMVDLFLYLTFYLFGVCTSPNAPLLTCLLLSQTLNLT